MYKYIEPEQNTFDDVEHAAMDMLSGKCPDLATKAGSAVRELIVRPLSYLYSWAYANIDSLTWKSSASYLKTSQEVDNQIADAMASNYFISRRTGSRSRGVITGVVNEAYVQIAQDSEFVVSDVRLLVPYRVLAMPAAETRIVNNVYYTSLVPCGSGKWFVQLPVESATEGAIELPAGLTATPQFSTPMLIEATLTSALTGGSGTETDAQLMARAAAATTNGGIGSYYGIKKKLDNGPINVMSFNLAAGEDAALIRARYNNVNINPGGVVDCYVKTQNQLSCVKVTATPVVANYTEPDSDGVVWKYAAELPSTAGVYRCQGALYIDGALVGASGTVIQDYAVRFASNTGRYDWVGARLGVDQRVIVYFDNDTDEEVTANLVYMPGLLELQRYVDRDENKFVGQDIKIKAAVPVELSIDCALSYTGSLSSDQLDNIKQAMSDFVNGTKVGAMVLNYSDVKEYCSSVLPGASLRLPCSISASMPLMGGRIDTFYSNTGILDISTPANSDRWNPSICYFSLRKDSIRITQV